MIYGEEKMSNYYILYIAPPTVI